MNQVVNFDSSIGKFVGIVNGQKFKSKYKDHVERQILAYRKQFHIVEETEHPLPVTEPDFSINEKFGFIEKFVRMVGTGASNSLIVTGDGGLGKTHTVMTTLDGLGLKNFHEEYPEADYDIYVIKGHSTAKAMYRKLFENNGKLIVFDDCDSVFRDTTGANILKGALDSNERRVISWNAEQRPDDDLPTRFEFTGRVIFISNLSLDKVPQALISRSLRCDVTMTVNEKIERIEYIMETTFAKEYGSDVVFDVSNFMKQHKNDFTDLNVRTAINLCKLRQFDHSANWERAALYLAKS